MKSTVCTYAIQKLENRTRWQAARHSRAADYCTQGTNFFPADSYFLCKISHKSGSCCRVAILSKSVTIKLESECIFFGNVNIGTFKL